MEQHSFGHWLKLIRKGPDLTREQLAEHVGYSAATIRKYQIGMVLDYWFKAEKQSESSPLVEKGRAMTMEQAIAYALESRDV